MMEKDANAQAPTKPEGANLRGADRDEVFLRTLMSCDHRNGIGGQLVNISPRGFMVRTLEAFTNGSRIRILLPLAGDMPGQVIWALGGRIGCTFDTQIDEKLYVRLLAAIKATKPNWYASG